MLVSIIITTYNRPEALTLVLKSIEDQTFYPYEVIIADDGSSFSTQDAIINYKKNSNLNIIHSWHEDNGFRASEARNKAIALSQGEYLILIDGDMVLHSKFIQNHISNSENGFFIQGTRVLLNQRSTKMAIEEMKTNFSFFSKGVKNRKNAIYSNFFSKFFLKKSNNLQGIKTCNMSFFKKDCIKINGFNNSFRGWGREDSEFAVRLLNNGIKRKNLRFNGIQFHLWHPENNRKSLIKNELILKSSLEAESKWCENGVNKFL